MAVEISGDTTPGLAADFWRSGPGTGLPDGATDTTDPISHRGRLGIGDGWGAAASPTSQFEIAGQARSGTQGNTAAKTFYLTGGLPSIGSSIVPLTPVPDGGAEFRHSNGTQGIGVAYDGLYAAGSNAHQQFLIQQKGNGVTGFKHQVLNGGYNYHRHSGPAIANAQGWYQEFWANSVREGADLIRRITGVAGGTLGVERYWQARRPDGAFVNAFRSTWSGQNPNSPAFWVNPGNQVGDRLLTLWGDPSSAAGSNVYSVGIRSSELAFFTRGNGASFRWRRSSDGAVALALLSNNGSGILTIDPPGVSAGVGGGNPAIRVGGEASTEQIASNRTAAGRFLNDLEIGTAGVRRFAVLNNGRIYMANVPTFANDGAAGAGGLAVGELYKSAAGDVKVKL